MLRLVVNKGDRFNDWTVIKEIETCRGEHRKFLCENSGGRIQEVLLYLLRNGESTGFFQRNIILKHGMSYTRVYSSWRDMKSRCLNSNTLSYKNYGGRDITVCDRWLNSFENFYEDMGKCPKGLTLERVNNNGNYTPENCRWATWKEQQNNRRPKREIERTGVMYKEIWQ